MFTDRLAERVMDRMAHDERFASAGADDLIDLFIEFADAVIPKGRALWRCLVDEPEFGDLPGPSPVASTIEGVVRDVVRDAIEPTVLRWANAIDAANAVTTP